MDGPVMTAGRWTAAAAWLLAAALLGAGPARAQATGAEEAGPQIPLSDRFRPVYEGRIYLVKVNFHQPQRAMQLCARPPGPRAPPP